MSALVYELMRQPCTTGDPFSMTSTKEGAAFTTGPVLRATKMDSTENSPNRLPNVRGIEAYIGDALSHTNKRAINESLNELTNVYCMENLPNYIFHWLLNHGEARHVDPLFDALLKVGIRPSLKDLFMRLTITEFTERCREVYRRLCARLTNTLPKKCRQKTSELVTLFYEADELAYEWIDFILTENCREDYRVGDLHMLALTGDFRVTRLLDKLFALGQANFYRALGPEMKASDKARLWRVEQEDSEEESGETDEKPFSEESTSEEEDEEYYEQISEVGQPEENDFDDDFDEDDLIDEYEEFSERDQYSREYRDVIRVLEAVCVFRNNVPAYLRIRSRYAGMFHSVERKACLFERIERLASSPDVLYKCMRAAIRNIALSMLFLVDLATLESYYGKLLACAIDTSTRWRISARSRLKLAVRIGRLEYLCGFDGFDACALRMVRPILQGERQADDSRNSLVVDIGEALRKIICASCSPLKKFRRALFEKVVELVQSGTSIESAVRSDILYGLLLFYDCGKQYPDPANSENALRTLLLAGEYFDTYNDGPLPELFRFMKRNPDYRAIGESAVNSILESQCRCLHPNSYKEIPPLRCLAAAKVPRSALTALDNVQIWVNGGLVSASLCRFVNAHMTLESDRTRLRRDYRHHLIRQTDIDPHLRDCYYGCCRDSNYSTSDDDLD
ncbi:hypothetical protein BIW11_07146 [Tropilaelaps mercedesae]|uniref:Uncharacterized protein n=1 Tax=Tropilaelaps mercedesae TaxID=418985 RepID=A0A1V9XV97_9ACAR|nr:hypothetical protein BIW11_07146 [Tropilaelaps mercedesae]